MSQLHNVLDKLKKLLKQKDQMARNHVLTWKHSNHQMTNSEKSWKNLIHWRNGYHAKAQLFNMLNITLENARTTDGTFESQTFIIKLRKTLAEPAHLDFRQRLSSDPVRPPNDPFI